LSELSLFKNLLSPFQIKNVKIKNRIVKAPQASGNATKEGAPTDGAFEYYEALAKGGVGLIDVEGASVDYPLGVVGWPRLGIQDDKFIPIYKKLTDMIHSYGATAFLEIQHCGPSHPKPMSGLQPVSASVLADNEKPVKTFDDCRELSFVEIKDIQQKFVKAAERAQKAGFDGIDLHGAHRYLINAFLSCAWNKRNDEYGCQNLENRARFTVEIIKAIKEKLGKDLLVGIRYNVAEWGLKNGLTVEDGIEFGKMFEKAGADFLNISGYGYGNYLWGYWGEQLRAFEPAPEVKPWIQTIDDPGFIISQAERVKKAVAIPIICGSRIKPEVADQDIAKGRTDLVFFARRLIADPYFPNKLTEGRLEDIAPCTACSECWDSTTTLHRSVLCRINASSGREHEFTIKPAAKKKKVLVVGGGPAGMEAARVAALRGHEVALYEKQPRLGGSLPLASMIKGVEIEDLGGIVKYLNTQIIKAGVRVKTGQEVNSQLIQGMKPDVIILATGGQAVNPQIPGIDKKIFVSQSKLHQQAKMPLNLLGPKFLNRLTRLWMPIGKRVIIIGGAIHGVQLAEFLVERGRKVTIVETSAKFGGDMVVILAERLINWLKKKGVTMLGEVKLEEITEKGLTISTKDGKKQTIEADSIISALPLSANTELFKSIEGKFPEIYAIGDCHEPHRIIQAIQEGSSIGHKI